MTQACMAIGVSDYEAELLDVVRSWVAIGGHKHVADAAGVSPSALSDHLAERERKRVNPTIIAAAILVCAQRGEVEGLIGGLNRLLRRFGIEVGKIVVTPEVMNARLIAKLLTLGDVGRSIIAGAQEGR